MGSADPWPAMNWTVVLVDGVTITIASDSTFADGDYQVFEVALGVTPLKLIEVARVPRSAIIELESHAINALEDL